MSPRSHHGLSLSPPSSGVLLTRSKHGTSPAARDSNALFPMPAAQPHPTQHGTMPYTPFSPDEKPLPDAGHDSLSIAQALVDSRGGPGVLVLSSSLKLLYMNEVARTLTGPLNRTIDGRKASGVLPPEIMDFCEELLRLMKVRTGPKDWEQAQLQRISGNALGFVLLRGLGIPATAGHEAHLLVTLEEINMRRAMPAERVQSRFHLTDREQTVVIYLLKGLTNKEIAGRMAIAEQTVKEHVKHIMHKTNSTTRTGVLSQILLAPGRTP